MAARPHDEPQPALASEPSPLKGISRNVFLLGLVSLLTDFSSEMIYPLVPLFLTSELGATVSIVGVIEGFAEATASLLKGASGWLSDRLGLRRPLVTAGYSTSALAKPLLALAAGWPLVLTARLVDRFGKGVRGSPRDALLADSTTRELRGRAFGFHRSADQTGAIIGPLVALPLLALFQNNFRAVFLAAFLPAVAGALLTLAVRESRGPHHQAGGGRIDWRAAAPPQFRRFLLIVVLFGVGNSSDAFLLLRARDAGFTVGQVVLLFTLLNAVYVACAYPAGILSDRAGRRALLAGGFGVFAAVYLGFGLVAGGWGFWLLFALYGAYLGVTDGVARAFVVDLVPARTRASALGLHAMITGLVQLPASILAGQLWDRIGVQTPFLVGAASALAAGLLFLFWFPPRGSSPAPQEP